MENLGNEMSIGCFEKLEHTPGNLEGHIAREGSLQAPEITEQALRSHLCLVVMLCISKKRRRQ